MSGLRGNFTRNNTGIARFIGGGAQALTPGNWWRIESWRASLLRDGETTARKTTAKPTGYYPQGAWRLPIVAGEMTAGLSGEGDLNGNGAAGLNAAATLSGAGDLIAIGNLIVALSATLSGAGDITSAGIQAILVLSASLSGAGELTATMNAIGELAATLSGAGDIPISTTITATGEMEATITVSGDLLTTANVAAAILDAADTIEVGLNLRQLLRGIGATLLGELSGAGTTTITIRNALVDNKNRVVATVDSDGNRSSVVLDLD